MRIAVGSDERTELTGDVVATAGGARRWNDANTLAMSLRGVSTAVATEIPDARFAKRADDSVLANIKWLKSMDRSSTPFALDVMGTQAEECAAPAQRAGGGQ